MDKVTMVGRRYQTTWHCPCLLQDHPLCPTGSSAMFYSPWFSSGKSGKAYFQVIEDAFIHDMEVSWNGAIPPPSSMDFPWHKPSLLGIPHPTTMETKAWPSEAVTPHGGTDLAKTWRSAEGLPWGWLDGLDMVDIYGCYLLVQNIAKTDFLRFWLGFLIGFRR